MYNKREKVETATLSLGTFTRWQDYMMLVKFRLTFLVVITSLIGYAVAAGSHFQWISFMVLGIGGLLVTSAANALNQVLEKDFDILMDRTKMRPVAAGRMKSSEAVLFAGFSCLIGITALASFNPLAALLGMISLITYAFIYTPLKRYSTLSVAIGGIPGALPVLIGYTAYSGEITILAFILFGIQFLWQFPHFWSIGYLSFDDYKNAGYRLLPEVNGKIDPNIGLYSAVYAMSIIPFVSFLYWISNVSVFPVILCIVLSLGYAFFCIDMYRNQDKRSAMRLMFSSFFYLPVVLLGFLIWL